MAVERAQPATNLVDVLDRVLDKGIVIDAWVRVSLVGIDLLTVEARVVVASIATYLQFSETVSQMTTASKPAGGTESLRPSGAARAALPAHFDALLAKRSRKRTDLRS